MKKALLKNAIAAALSCSVMFAASGASAGFVLGAGYYDLSAEDISLGVAGATIGYTFESAGSIFSLTPELRAGTGVKEDSFLGADVEISKFYGVNLRGQWKLGNSAYIFLAPSYTNTEVDISFAGFSEVENSWEFGGGAGIGFMFNDSGSIELSYEEFDDVEVTGIALRFKF
jgi:hypothetical protein